MKTQKQYKNDNFVGFGLQQDFFHSYYMKYYFYNHGNFYTIEANFFFYTC